MRSTLEVTPEERRLQRLLRIYFWVAAALAVAAAVALGRYGKFRSSSLSPWLGLLAVVGIATFALLAFFAAANVRRYRVLVLLLVVGHVLGAVISAAVLLFARPSGYVWFYGHAVGQRAIGWTCLAVDAVCAVVIWLAHRKAERCSYKLLYFSPTQFRAAVALADVLIMGDEESLTAEQVARNVDRYLSNFEARSKWLSKLVFTAIEFYPLLSFRPPFSYMNASDRLAFIKARFYQDVQVRFNLAAWRDLVRALIRMAKQLSYIGYYNDPRTHAAIGYVRFKDRDDYAARLQQLPSPPRQPLRVDTPSEIMSDELVGDVVIVGSGAAASVLAHGLAKAGRSVLMLERGDYVDPSQFNDDEMEMISRLYKDGALQTSRDFALQVMQGSCVGGSTVVNNAVCFDLPPDVLDRWNDPHSLNAGIDANQLWTSFKEVRNLVGVEPQNHTRLNKGADLLRAGVQKLGLDLEPNKLGVVEANLRNCLGCGYCNIGCRFDRKLSMLVTLLPRTQREYGYDKLRIVAGCEALKFHADGHAGGNGNGQSGGRKVTSLTCRLKDGRTIRVKGNTFVLSAGAISSSLVLLQSDLDVPNVGKYLSFNNASPMFGVFDKPVNAYDGLQIAVYLQLNPSRGYVIETFYNTPVFQALTVPGWFEDHYINMRRYDRMALIGVLVGMERNGVVKRGGITGRDIRYEVSKADFDKMIDGLILAGNVLFEAGATSVMPSTFDYFEFKSPEELEKLRDLVRDADDLSMGGGHPQGGNVMSRDPAKGVVDSDFRVHGFNNFFVCDASVFPSCTGVNPQLTVMALAQCAVPHVAAS